MPEAAIDLALSETSPPKGTGIVLNMIIGDFREPFLTPTLEALADKIDWAVINLNGDDTKGVVQENLKDIMASRFAKEERLTLMGLPFRNYAFNRNVCLDTSRDCEWMIQMDGDEVLDPLANPRELVKIAEEKEVSRIHGYYWHYMKGLDTVQNAAPVEMLYGKVFMWKIQGWSEPIYWHGVVHEHLSGPYFRDLIVSKPLWHHFGYVNATRVWKKWLRFSSLDGSIGRYNGYFSNPNAPWLRAPKDILNGPDRTIRKRSDFGVELPPQLDGLALDGLGYVHKATGMGPENMSCCPRLIVSGCGACECHLDGEEEV